ncbi:hypothetical protein A8B78_06805 [Jannaschia sp. EhC01]|nr:hypothetical protein A8B78_06805 [Jannaschia sp. EhC01]
MKTASFSLALALVASPVFAIDMGFSGTVSMGLFGTSSGSEIGVTPYLGIEAEATISFEIGDDALTVGVILPIDVDIVDESFLPSHR